MAKNMKISFSKSFLAFGAAFLVMFTSACMNSSGERNADPKQGILSLDSGPLLNKGEIKIHYYLPAGKTADMQLQFVMHGAGRNADDYLEGWKARADEYGLIIIAPELTKESFSSEEYIGGRFLAPEGDIADPASTTFSLIDRIFEFVRDELKLQNRTYNIYGHSAGGQFTHRFMQFYASPYVDKAVAANAGWYTFPDDEAEYPYGIKGLFHDSDSLRKGFYSDNLTILLGTADTIRDKDLRQTPEADLQGLTRLERGEQFFDYNKARAEETGFQFGWQKVYVPGSGHDHTIMSPAAADFLYGQMGLPEVR